MKHKLELFITINGKKTPPKLVVYIDGRCVSWKEYIDIIKRDSAGNT